MELDQLHQRILRKSLVDDDYSIFSTLVQNLIIRYEKRVDRLNNKANNIPEGSAPDDVIDVESSPAGPSLDQPRSNDDSGAPADDSRPPADDPGAPPDDSEKNPPPPDTNGRPPESTDGKKGGQKKSKGHGRGGAGSFINATHIYHGLAPDALGTCDRCQMGRLYRHRKTTKIHIHGQPMFRPAVHHYEQGRCHDCGAIVTADGPGYVEQGIGKAVVYGFSACAMLIVLHYYATLPFKRLESLHKSWGIPFADANQWEVVQSSDQMLRPLYDAVEQIGMKTAISISLDDTGSMVVEIQRQIKYELEQRQKEGQSCKDVRTGINATGIILETPHGRVVLYMTGLHHGGEIFEKLMQHREAIAQPLIKITDAASKNFDHGQRDLLIETVCHAHCYLAFKAIQKQYPNDYAVVAGHYKKLFEHDKFAKETKMSPKERMAYHATHSRPLMEGILGHCKQILADKRAEPNSPLWKPVTFVINQWPRLSLFYQAEDIPLHTNLTEQILINVVRYLNVSFNYKTKNGAEVGDRHMSLIATARACGVEPVAYLTDCLKNHEDIAKNPHHYLPWVWRERHKQHHINNPDDKSHQVLRMASG